MMAYLVIGLFSIAALTVLCVGVWKSMQADRERMSYYMKKDK